MLLVTVGRGAGFGIALLTNIIIVRLLGPAEYGIYSTGMAMILVLTGTMGESLDFGVLKFIPLYLKQEENKARQIVNATFKLKLLSGLFLFLLSVLFDADIARLLFKNTDLRQTVRVAVFGVIGIFMLKSVTSYLQASERFHAYLVVELSHILLKFGAILALFYIGMLTPFSALAVFAMASFIIFFSANWLMPEGCLRIGGIDKEALSTVIHFTKWVILSSGVAAMHARLDIFMLGLLRGSEDVGIYSAAITLGMIPELLGSFVIIFLYPKIMPLYERGVLKDHLVTSLKYSVPACMGAIVVAIWLADPVIRIFYTEKYLASIPLLRVIVVRYIFWWLSGPLAAPFLSMLRPRLILCINVIVFLFLLVGNALVIPLYGPLGAAWINVITYLSVEIALLWSAFNVLRLPIAHNSVGVYSGDAVPS